MDKRLIFWLLIVGVLAFFSGRYTGIEGFRRSLKKGAGLDSIVLVQLAIQDSVHRAQIALYDVKLNDEVNSRKHIQQAYADSLSKLRARPVRIVQVPETKVYECDSAVAVGNSYKRQVEVQELIIMEQRQALAVADSTNEILGGIVVKKQLDNIELNESLKNVQGKLESKSKAVKIWQGVSGGLGVILLAGILIL